MIKKFFPYFLYALLSGLALLMVVRHVEIIKSKKITEIELRYEENLSLTYDETIEAYKALAKQYLAAKLFTYGNTDSGKPLHLFVISKSKNFSPQLLREKGYRIILVNNGIHPGEPCGVDASVQLARNILQKTDNLWELMDSTVLCIVPIYNIGGALNRSPQTRANQDGPIGQGFRGNAKNLDLNRDFAPMFSSNAQSFAQIFQLWKPHLLIDTHTTNGADYQYTMTLIPTHPQEVPASLGDLFSNELEPFLYNAMKESGYEMIPYVSPMGRTPESGLQHELFAPRYTMGYARMFNTLSFTTEAHMLKPFKDRVLATYEFMVSMLNYSHTHGVVLDKAKREADEFVASQKEFVIAWSLDSSRVEQIEFKGYEAEFFDSKFTGGKRLKYNQEKPFTKMIPYYKHYTPKLTITTPDFYVIPQAWNEVIDRLALNNVQMTRMESDMLIEVEALYITHYDNHPWPSNGYRLHTNVKVRPEVQQIQFYKGDYLIPTNQVQNRYIVEMLEPQAEDSFFAWYFFEPILQRREYFSPYLFEDTALELLENNEELRAEFEEKKRIDAEFRSNPNMQLTFLYERSQFFEKSYMRYPVYRLHLN